jgi:hypothetical protein
LLIEILFHQARKFDGELPPTISIFRKYRGLNCGAEFEMEIDTEDDEANAKKFRDYAAECRRMAGFASAKDRAVLIEMRKPGCSAQKRRSARPSIVARVEAGPALASSTRVRSGLALPRRTVRHRLPGLAMPRSELVRLRPTAGLMEMAHRRASSWVEGFEKSYV